MSFEVAGGVSRAEGGARAGLAELRVLPGRWGGGTRVQWLEGEDRGRGPENFREVGVFVIRRVDMPSSALYVGVGVGHLSGEEYRETEPLLDDVERVGLAMEAVLHWLSFNALRMSMGARGHVADGRLAGSLTVGLALGTNPKPAAFGEVP